MSKIAYSCTCTLTCVLMHIPTRERKRYIFIKHTTEVLYFTKPASDERCIFTFVMISHFSKVGYEKRSRWDLNI